jgi:hypothetical protein
MAVGDGQRNPRQHRGERQQSSAVSYAQRMRLGLGAPGWMVFEVFAPGQTQEEEHDDRVEERRWTGRKDGGNGGRS